jgi:PAS domain-containing protein
MAELLEELVVVPGAPRVHVAARRNSSRAPFFENKWDRFQSVEEGQLPTLVLDARGTIQVLTPAARRLLDYQPGQPIKPSFFSHVHAKDLYRVLRDVAEMTFHGKQGASWRLRLRTGDGGWHWFSATVDNQLNEPEGALLISLDHLTE